MRQIVLDTETTGLEPEQGHRIIEIGCVELVNRRPTGNSFHYYLNPERGIDPGAQEVHGISAEFLADKPRFAEIAGELKEFLRGTELLIHNAPFDVGFLDNEFALAGGGLADTTVAGLCAVLDTLVLAREMHPGQRNSLDALCRRYQVDNSGREPASDFSNVGRELPLKFGLLLDRIRISITLSRTVARLLAPCTTVISFAFRLNSA